MAIKMMEDLVAPAGVGVVNIVMERYQPTYSEYATYGMTGIGYGAALMGWGPAWLKNVGIASLPGTLKNVYDRVRGIVGTPVGVSRLGSRVSRYPAPAEKSPFGAARLV